MKWSVALTRSSAKNYSKLPAKIKDRVDFLVKEIQISGPIRGNWKNYSKLGEAKHHCHLKAGRPTYVACWETVDLSVRIVEIYYVGTHEKAPY